ncbi:MAG: DMT family transporter [Myxococcales bacterium]|jgi:drug/metabolite transporter (DMT)-like permease
MDLRARTLRFAQPTPVLLLATIGWALTYPVVKDSLAHASTGAFLAIRFAVGALAALPFALRAGLDRASLARGALLGLLLWLGFVLNTWGLAFTTASRTGFITSLCVVLVPVFGALFFRLRAHLAAYLGAGLATIGLFVMSAPSLFADGGSLLGDGLVIASALVLSFHILFTGRFAPRVKPAVAVFAQITAVALLSALTLPFEQVRFEVTASLVATILFTGVFASALFVYAQLWAQARVSAVRAALIFTLEPLLSALFSRLLLNDPLPPTTLTGGGLIVAAVLLGELWPRLAARRAAAPARPAP